MWICLQDRSAIGSTRLETREKAARPDCALLVTTGVGLVAGDLVGAGPVVDTQAASKGRMARESIFVFITHHIVTVYRNVIPSYIMCEVVF